jgi:hydroxyethylthiazole kinase
MSSPLSRTDPDLATADADAAWLALGEVRRRAPLVHGITNYVTMDITANALLALGASPAMAHAEEEVADFAGIADALVVNIGTLSPGWVRAMVIAAGTMVERRKPWVLDPVGAGATAYRTEVAADLARRGPSVVRGNASEIMALAGGPQATRGVDSVHASEGALEVARWLAGDLGCVVAVTGAVDYVTDGDRTASIHNGHPMMARVTALGCTATSLIAAFLAVEKDPVQATVHALAVLGLCGELAARASEGPGTLRWRILDSLYSLDRSALEGVRVNLS